MRPGGDAKVSAFGGILQYESRALQDFERARQGRRRLRDARRQRMRRQADDDRQQLIDDEITAYLESLSAEASSEQDAQAVAEASEAERARYDKANSSFRGLLLTGIRRAHVRKILGLPAGS